MPAHDPYAALRSRNFRLYLGGNIIAILGMQMQSVAVGWEIYERTGSAMALGWVGLIQVIPVLSLALVTGHVADRFDRKKILCLALAAISSASIGMALISSLRGPILGLYACLLANGIARAFLQPAKSAFLPQIVERQQFTSAVTWATSGFQLASIIGPALGGLLISFFQRPAVVYAIDSMTALSFLFLLTGVTYRRVVDAPQNTTLKSLLAGIQFLKRNEVLLGAMTLDMFAVLLGGAVTLLPIYAKDILAVGPHGLGWMQAAPSVGALLMSFTLAHRPPLKKAGRALLWSVVGFGVATIAFGFSRSFQFSLVMLFLTGAFDTVSVVVRSTLVQILTPDEMRGRVSALNGVFIGASNELGGFESGLVAALFNPTVSVVGGGIGTIVVVATVALLWPALRQFGRLDGNVYEAAAQAEAQA